MDWLQFIAGIGLGTLGAKALDIFLLQQRQNDAAHRAWLRDKRLEAFSEVIREFWSFGLHEGDLRSSFQSYASVARALLLLDDDSLVTRIDHFVVEMDRMNTIADRSTPEAGDEAAAIYESLVREAREIAKLLRNVVLHERVRHY